MNWIKSYFADYSQNKEELTRLRRALRRESAMLEEAVRAAKTRKGVIIDAK